MNAGGSTLVHLLLIPLHSIYSRSCWPNPWQDTCTTRTLLLSTIRLVYKRQILWKWGIQPGSFLLGGIRPCSSSCQFLSIQFIAEAADPIFGKICSVSTRTLLQSAFRLVYKRQILWSSHVHFFLLIPPLWLHSVYGRSLTNSLKGKSWYGEGERDQLRHQDQ